MLCRILPFFALICLSDAKQTARTPAEWEDELSATFAKNSGYIARYKGHSQDCRMEATIGTDKAGTSLSQLIMIEGEKQETVRMWTSGDEYNINAGGPGKGLLFFGLNQQLEKTLQLTNEFALTPDEKKPGPMTLEPRFMISKTDLLYDCSAAFPSRPPWKAWTAEAIGAVAGEEEVVFDLGADGEIAVSRKSGMMTRQTLEGENGGRRELALVSVELNPSAEALSELKKGWSNEGAQKSDCFSNYRAHLTIIFATKVSQVNRGEVTVEQLEEVLQAKADFLRTHFRQFFGKLDPEEKTTWKEYIDHAKGEVKQKLKSKLGDTIDEAQLNAQLDTPEVKTEIRESLTRDRASNRRNLLPSLLGETYEQFFKASNENGKRAVKAIEDAVIHALIAAEIEIRMEEVW